MNEVKQQDSNRSARDLTAVFFWDLPEYIWGLIGVEGVGVFAVQ